MSSNQREIRRLPFEDAEIEFRSESDAKIISGFAAVFNKLSEDLGGFREQIAPGAFQTSIKGEEVKAFWAHDDRLVLGSSGAGTLKLEEKSKGLWFELSLPDTQAGRDAYVSIQRRDVTGVSFGFVTREDAWDYKKNGKEVIRTVKDVRLYEVSPVAFPAYPQTSVTARALTDVLEEGMKKLALTEKQEEQPKLHLLRFLTLRDKHL